MLRVVFLKFCGFVYLVGPVCGSCCSALHSGNCSTFFFNPNTRSSHRVVHLIILTSFANFSLEDLAGPSTCWDPSDA